MTPLLQVRDLLVERGKRPVLELNELLVERGEVLAVVGPNGAGKSTLLLALARLLHPSHGEVILNGQHASAESDLAYRRRIALVLQDPLLFDTSVFENVASGLRFRNTSSGEIKQRVSAWLERLGISHLERRRASQLSGGEAQRVSLARALVLEPELLLLDEPFSALDPPTRARLVDDLGRLLRAAHVTTVFVTHDLEEAAQLADHIAVLLGGRLRQHGTPQGILKAPADQDIRAFLGK